MKTKNSIVKYVKRRLWQQDLSCYIMFLGKPGIGKSLSATVLAKHITKDWSLDHLVFTPEDFMKLVHEGNLKRGDTIIWDEAGCGLDAREFLTLSNRVLSHAFQTLRYKNVCVIMTVPDRHFVDVNVRQLFDVLFEGVARKKEYVRFKLFFLTYDAVRKRKEYQKYPRLKGNVQLRFMRIYKLADKLMLKEYKKKKKQFTDLLYEDAFKTIERVKEKNEPKEPNAECKKCGYTWFYSGKAKPRCPRCSSSVVVVNKPLVFN